MEKIAFPPVFFFFPEKYSITKARKLNITKTASQPAGWGSFHRLPMSVRNGMSELRIMKFCLKPLPKTHVQSYSANRPQYISKFFRFGNK